MFSGKIQIFREINGVNGKWQMQKLHGVYLLIDIVICFLHNFLVHQALGWNLQFTNYVLSRSIWNFYYVPLD